MIIIDKIASQMNSFKVYYKKYQKYYSKYVSSKNYLKKKQKKYSKNMFMNKNFSRKIEPVNETLRKKCNKLALKKVFGDYHFLTFNLLNLLKICFNILTFLLLNRFKYALLLVYALGEVIQCVLILKLQVPKVIFLYNMGQGMFLTLFLFMFVAYSLYGNVSPGLLFDVLVILFNLGVLAINYLLANSPKFCTVGEVDQDNEKSQSETKNNNEGNQEKK
jgi:hypothetical protein